MRPLKTNIVALEEPGDDTALCLAASTQNGTWFSQPCYDLKPYICKLPAVQDDSRPSITSVYPALTCSCHPGTEATTAAPHASRQCDSGWTYSPSTKDCWTTKLYSSWAWPGQVNQCARHNSTAISIDSAEANHAAAAFAQANGANYRSVWLGLHAPNVYCQLVDNSTYNYAAWSTSGETNCESVEGDCYVAMSIENGTDFGKWTGYSNGWGPDPNGLPIICVKSINY